jgi:lantibiotic leader peptide-processing serine protease
MQRLFRITAALVLVLSAMLFGASAGSAAPAQTGTTETYLVLYKGNKVPADAATQITKAGGALVYAYDAIGVVIASSDSDTFRATLVKDNRIEGAMATTNFASPLQADVEEEVTADAVIPPNFNYLWDMQQISVPQAHAITLGSPDIVVGDIDTGLDYNHPALAPNVDFSRSVSCVGGVPNQTPSAWMDDNGHGTHTAGTIAARPYTSGNYSIVGVAPNVKIAGIKASTKAGYFYPEAVVCSFMWAADHGIAVTNNSYYADPWLYNCRNDADQRVIWKAEQRAIRYAMSKGVVVVAAMGNEAQDLSKKNVDATSPDDGTIVTREVTNACVEVPVEISGVIGVTALTSTRAKASYSNYGVGVANVSAPGSSIRSTRWRGTTTSMSGTSMASPHVAGVAALIVSQFGRIPPGAVQALIQNTADPLPCPATATTCQGGPDYNGYFGHGEVNAFSAVTAKR